MFGINSFFISLCLDFYKKLQKLIEVYLKDCFSIQTKRYHFRIPNINSHIGYTRVQFSLVQNNSQDMIGISQFHTKEYKIAWFKLDQFMPTHYQPVLFLTRMLSDGFTLKINNNNLYEFVRIPHLVCQ